MFEIGGKELMMHILAVPYDPILYFLHRTAAVTHIGSIIDQQSVARRAAQRINDGDLSAGILFREPYSCFFGVMYRLRHAGT